MTPVAIVGAGRMGRGIALAFAYSGRAVRLIDGKARVPASQTELWSGATAELRADLSFLAMVGAITEDAIATTASRVDCFAFTEGGRAVADCDLIFEAVPETLDAKRACFDWLGRHADRQAIVASTTSTIEADRLAPMLAEPDRFLNAHWLNPAHLMPVVEIAPAGTTDPMTVTRLRDTLRAMGKLPVVCRGPGYIVPRIQALAMNEAARMIEEGVADADDIDTAVRAGFGLRFAVLGLLEFIDWGGGDILHHATGFLSETIDPARFAAPDIIASNMGNHRRGLRDGVGFYDYAGVDTAAYRDQRMTELVALLRLRGLMPAPARG